MSARRRMGAFLASAALIWVLPLVGPADAGVGDVAPEFEGKEFINTPQVSLNDLKGRVIFYEIFRTW